MNGTGPPGLPFGRRSLRGREAVDVEEPILAPLLRVHARLAGPHVPVERIDGLLLQVRPSGESSHRADRERRDERLRDDELGSRRHVSLCSPNA